MSDEKEHPLVTLIQAAAKANPGTPFLKHIMQFCGEKSEITYDSIYKNWKQLTGQNCLLLATKAKITMNGANEVAQVRAKRAGKSCPAWKYNFKDASELMVLLKHSCDTGIINKDGSINIEALTKVMISYCELHNGKWLMRKSSMVTHIAKRAEEDKKEAKTNPDIILAGESWLNPLPGFELVAKAEWEDEFAYFNDAWIKNKDGTWEPAMTAETFLQFYFESDKLFKRKISGELPAKHPLS